jgi:hypothetical protein
MCCHRKELHYIAAGAQPVDFRVRFAFALGGPAGVAHVPAQREGERDEDTERIANTRQI